MLAFGGTLYLSGLLGTLIFRKEALGFGDVKLGLVLGSFLGTEQAFLALFLSFIFAALISIILLITKEVSKDHLIPFGPSLAAGTLLTLLTRTITGSNHILNWYFTTMWTGEYFF